MAAQTIFGRLLNTKPGRKVEYFRDGAISCDDKGIITYAGSRRNLPASLDRTPQRRTDGIILPPFLDAHIHIPQHPIRGRFMEGVEGNPPQGRLLAGLNRNVFPTESKCSADEYTRATVEAFLRDTLAKGVIGGAAYMTVHPNAARIALEMLPETWFVGLVLMNMNCPEYLRTSEKTLEEDVRSLAEDFGKRLIVTDRFAVAVDTPLRKRASRLAGELGLRMQTHLDEQIGEKAFVEKTLYPDYASYTDVYRRDGLLDHRPILAHCIHMRDDELKILQEYQTFVAHCPTSNTLLGSGVMDVRRIADSGHDDFAICTDVGASPTTSLLAELATYLKVHGTSGAVGAAEGLCRITQTPAEMLEIGSKVGTFETGMPMSFVEVAAEDLPTDATDDEVVQLGLLGMTEEAMSNYRRGEIQKAIELLRNNGLDHGPELALLEVDIRRTASRLENKVLSVTVGGKEVFRREDRNSL